MDVTGLRAERAEGERVSFDPRRHPGIVKRLVLLGHTRREVAAVLGIAESTLAAWFRRHPELDQARVEANMRGAHLADAAYRLALGEWDPVKQEYKGGDSQLMRFLLERKHGFVRPTAEQQKEMDRAAAPDGRLEELLDGIVDQSPELQQRLREVGLADPAPGPRGSRGGGHGTLQ